MTATAGHAIPSTLWTGRTHGTPSEPCLHPSSVSACVAGLGSQPGVDVGILWAFSTAGLPAPGKQRLLISACCAGVPRWPHTAAGRWRWQGGSRAPLRAAACATGTQGCTSLCSASGSPARLPAFTSAARLSQQPARGPRVRCPATGIQATGSAGPGTARAETGILAAGKGSYQARLGVTGCLCRRTDRLRRHGQLPGRDPRRASLTGHQATHKAPVQLCSCQSLLPSQQQLLSQQPQLQQARLKQAQRQQPDRPRQRLPWVPADSWKSCVELPRPRPASTRGRAASTVPSCGGSSRARLRQGSDSPEEGMIQRSPGTLATARAAPDGSRGRGSAVPGSCEHRQAADGRRDG